ncbi:MAG: hypothetical protein HY221_00140 [Candidatus Sungbacteria bacterium]|uniref:Uncharacterized protein n=1 Tax=Candidatus Sungiibacteriota bacterium TaxID=2750080 RepID=A0A932QXP1_9BACT|nr:hypothetical protein [Candidatus Sungbacteria bacterium]
MHDNYYHRHADYAVRPQDNAYIYDRPGYYDYNGYYLSQNNSLNVPRNMFPPHGMCRIWFPDRGREEQASLESCEGIQHRVPVGAYVVYGG